jgi:hypothetical protein
MSAISIVNSKIKTRVDFTLSALVIFGKTTYFLLPVLLLFLHIHVTQLLFPQLQ